MYCMGSSLIYSNGDRDGAKSIESARGTWPSHDVVRFTRSTVTRELSARTEAQESSPEVIERIDGGTYACMCRTANRAFVFSCCVLHV